MVHGKNIGQRLESAGCFCFLPKRYCARQIGNPVLIEKLQTARFGNRGNGFGQHQAKQVQEQRFDQLIVLRAQVLHGGYWAFQSHMPVQVLGGSAISF